MVYPCRRISNIKSEEILQFVSWLFDTYKKGVNFIHLGHKYGFPKSYAQHRLKQLLRAGKLFVPVKNKPRKYYPNDRKTDVIEYLSRQKNVLIQSTDTDHNLGNLEQQRANSLLEALQLSGSLPRYIHNIRLQISMSKGYYDEIDASMVKGNKAKKIECRIDGNNVNIFFYKNGTIQVQIACTKKPFKIEILDDEVSLMSFIGYVRGFICELLADRRGVIIPEISHWLLVECDVNVDVPITNTLLQTFPSIQMYPDTYRMQIHEPLRFTNFVQTMRIYAKSMGEKGVLRLEELQTPLALVPTAIHTLFHPNSALEKKVDYLTGLMEQRNTGNCNCACHQNPLPTIQHNLDASTFTSKE